MRPHSAAASSGGSCVSMLAIPLPQAPHAGGAPAAVLVRGMREYPPWHGCAASASSADTSARSNAPSITMADFRRLGKGMGVTLIAEMSGKGASRPSACANGLAILSLLLGDASNFRLLWLARRSPHSQSQPIARVVSFLALF